MDGCSAQRGCRMQFECAAHAADVVVRSVVTLKNIRACKLAGDALKNMCRLGCLMYLKIH